MLLLTVFLYGVCLGLVLIVMLFQGVTITLLVVAGGFLLLVAAEVGLDPEFGRRKRRMATYRK